MTKVLRLTLPVRVFEQLQAEAAAANLRGVELARRFIGARYAPGAPDGGEKLPPTGNYDANSRPSRSDSRALLDDGSLAFHRATDAYGRIALAVERVAEANRRAEIGKDLEIVGDAVAILPELIEQLEGAQARPEARGGRKAVPVNDNDDEADELST